MTSLRAGTRYNITTTYALLTGLNKNICVKKNTAFRKRHRKIHTFLSPANFMSTPSWLRIIDNNFHNSFIHFRHVGTFRTRKQVLRRDPPTNLTSLSEQAERTL